MTIQCNIQCRNIKLPNIILYLKQFLFTKRYFIKDKKHIEQSSFNSKRIIQDGQLPSIFIQTILIIQAVWLVLQETITKVDIGQPNAFLMSQRNKNKKTRIRFFGVYKFPQSSTLSNVSNGCANKSSHRKQNEIFLLLD